jgi:molecular chaperone GrpE
VSEKNREKEEIKQGIKQEAETAKRAKKREEPEELVTLEQYNRLKEQTAMCINLTRELQADFENYKRRTKDTWQEGIDEGIKQTCSVLLPALDAFKKAKKLTLDNSTLNGILMIETNLINSLEKLGVTKISTSGMFNPELHNAVMVTVDPNRESGEIIDELQAGFKFKDIILRIPDVVVAK